MSTHGMTLDIPYDDTVTTRKVDFGWDMTTKTSTVTSIANPGSNTYEFLASTDCGPTTCASPPLDFFTPEHQVQIFQVCVDPKTDKETFDLIGLDGKCTKSSTSSFFLVGIGSRIESDLEITLGPSPDTSTQGFPPEFDFNNSQKAFVINVRRYRTISIVKLSWKSIDLAEKFGVKCSATSCLGYSAAATNVGLAFADEHGPMSDEVFLLGENNYPISQVARFRNQYTEWTPLVMTLSLSPGSRELFADASISQSATWTKNENDKQMCSSEVERLKVTQTANHRYSGHLLQATYMSGFFSFFQFAAVHKRYSFIFDTRRTQLGDVDTDNYQFDGTTVEFFYALHIPEAAGQTSFRAMLILSIAVGVVFIMRVVSEVKKQAEADVNVTQFLEMLLNDAKYPASFAKTSLVDISGKTIESHVMTHYSVSSATLVHKKNTSSPIVLPLQYSAATVVTTKPASVRPDISTTTHAKTEVVNATAGI